MCNYFYLVLKTQINNLPQLKEKRKALRNKSTPAEIALWQLIKKKQLDGRRFRRQFSIGFYILDFYCHSEKLAVELDGAAHFTEEGRKKDTIRDEYLNYLGITVLRIENKMVFTSPDQVLEYIRSGFRV